MGGYGSGRRGTRPVATECKRLELADVLAGRAEAPAALLSTPQRLGGVRWWLCCPWCEGRARTLYYVKYGWMCRRCGRITDQSSCDSDVRVQRLYAQLVAHVEGRGPNPLATPEPAPGADTRVVLAHLSAGPSLDVLLKLARRLGAW